MFCCLFALIALGVQAAFADDADFAGEWMLTIEAPGVVPYEGLLDIERQGDSWAAYVENGPAPIRIDGNRIEITLDTRDRQGFQFQRLLKGTLEGREMSGVLHSVGILKTAAEYGEDGSPWTAVKTPQRASTIEKIRMVRGMGGQE